jgi:hypothetical protein
LNRYIDGSPQDVGWQRTTWTLELLAVQVTRDIGVRLGRPRVGLRIQCEGGVES